MLWWNTLAQGSGLLQTRLDVCPLPVHGLLVHECHFYKVHLNLGNPLVALKVMSS